MTLVAMNMILYKLCTVCLLNLSCVCISKVGACMYVLKDLQFQEGRRVSVAVCTDISGKELHRQVGMGKTVTSRAQVSTLANVRGVRSTPALSTIFHIFITHPREYFFNEQVSRMWRYLTPKLLSANWVTDRPVLWGLPMRPKPRSTKRAVTCTCH